MQELNLKIERLDHLGIVASTIKDLGIIKMIDDRIGTSKQEIVTTGEAIAAMVLNGLGFTSEPLYLSPSFFEDKPLTNLFGKDNLNPNNFNATKLSNSLDKIYEYGLEKLFFELAVESCSLEKIENKFQSLDTTSVSLTGEYDIDCDEHTISVTHGFSKDKRPDLKQIVHELLVSQDGGIPLMSKSWSGNASDNKIFQERTKNLVEHFGKTNFLNYLVADSKLYSKENSENLSKIKFITRIPNSITKVKNLIEETLDKKQWRTLNSKDKYFVKEINHYGITQRWIVVYSFAANSRAKKRVEKKILEEKLNINKGLKLINKQQIVNEIDITNAINNLIKNTKFHNTQYVIKETNDKVKGEKNYTVTATFTLLEQAKLKYIEYNSCYVVGSNAEINELSSEEIVVNYKNQNKSIENMGFRFLKDPVFFASSLFVKLPKRIESLLFIMTLSLLVYSIAQRKLRNLLEKNNLTVPNQLHKPTKTPTLKWVFKLLKGINVVYISVNHIRQKIVDGINNLQKSIIELFGDSAKTIYGFQT